MNEALILLISKLGPEILQLIRDRRAKQDPDAPPVTDAEVFAALGAAVMLTLAKGDAWKQTHPEEKD